MGLRFPRTAEKGLIMHHLGFARRFCELTSGTQTCARCATFGASLLGVFGDYCLQFPSDRCLKEQYWAGEGGGKEKKASLGYLCAVVWATKRSVRQRKRPHETALGVALTGIKAPSTTLGKGERAGKWVLFQFSAFLQCSDSFIYSISPTLAVMSI